jgi:hypothetical protein
MVLTTTALAAASPAFAHVTVHTDQPTRGASDAAVMFRTPNEESKAACVKLQVFFPANTPLLDVLVEPHPGWTSVARSARLAHPDRQERRRWSATRSGRRLRRHRRAAPRLPISDVPRTADLQQRRHREMD